MEILLFQCDTCGNGFLPKQKTQKFCSRACQILANNRVQRQKLAAQPDYAEKRHAKYAERRGGEVERVCECCGEKFATLDRRKQYCSERCKNKAGSQRFHEKNPHYARQRYWDDPESHRARSREWHAQNPEKSAEIQKRVYKKRTIQTPWKVLIQGARGRAIEKGIPFDLTEEWGKTRWTGNCELTGLPFTIERKRGSSRMYWPSIDRIDPKVGYLTSNCRIILHAVNALKGEGTDADILLVANAIVEALTR